MGLSGHIRVPSDKSISHRAVLFSGLASGTSHVKNLLPSDDVLCSVAAIEALGAHVELAEQLHGLSATIRGFAGHPQHDRALEIDCGNSGTTVRLLLGMLAGLGVRVRLYGDASLSSRPMQRVLKPLRAMGAHFDESDEKLPITICPAHEGHKEMLRALDYESPKASAQVKSALLLAGLCANGTTSIREPAKSRDHTERLLPAYGVPVHVEGLRVYVNGPAQLSACDVVAPADPSSAAFIAVAAALIEGSQVVIEQVALNPTRIGAFKVLERMGAKISYRRLEHLGAEPIGDVCVSFSPQLVATHVAEDEIPTLIDEIPVLALAAACAHGDTTFAGAGELRVKESDRFTAIREGLRTFGIRTHEKADDLIIHGYPPKSNDSTQYISGMEPKGEALVLPTYHDHRLAMTWHIAGLVFGKRVKLDDSACVAVSWPNFFKDIQCLNKRT